MKIFQRAQALVALSVFTTAVAGADPISEKPPTGHIRFETKVSDLRLGSNSLAAGLKPDDQIFIALPGEIFSQAVDIAPVPQADVQRSTLEGAAASDYAAFRAGDTAWIAANFARAEKEKIQADFTDQLILGRARDLFASYTQKKIVGRAIYKNYTIFFVNYRDWPVHLHAEVYTKEGNDWKRSNALADDEGFDIVAAALKSGRATPLK